MGFDFGRSPLSCSESIVLNNDIDARVELSDSPLRRLLWVSRHHRLHPGLVLVGIVHLDPRFVLDLRWPAVDTRAEKIHVRDETVILPRTVSTLLEWHAARQRMDRIKSLGWSGTDHVLVDQRGEQFDSTRADTAMEFFCSQVGLPVVPFTSLRHPCLR